MQPIATREVFTKKQQKAILILSNLADLRSEDAKAAEIGVHRTTVWRWKHDPIFQQELNRRVDANFMANRDKVLGKLIERAVVDGDTKAIQIYLTLSGDYVTRSQSMNLSISARAQQEEDQRLPQSPQEKQKYIAEILAETGFKPEEYTEVYKEVHGFA